MILIEAINFNGNMFQITIWDLGVSNNLTTIDILEHKTKTKTHYCFELTTIRQDLDKKLTK